MKQANLSLLSSKGDDHRKLAEELHTDNSDFKRLSAEAIRDCNCFAFSMPLSYSWKNIASPPQPCIQIETSNQS